MLIGRSSLVLSCLLCGCGTAPTPIDRQIACTLVVLKTGPKTDLPREESQKVFAGHFANMGRLAREGRLLLAGPFGKPRHDPALRGIFILDTDDRAAARALAETDPGFQAGVFVLEYHDLITPAPLRELLHEELVAQERAEKEGRKPAPGEGGRSYVMLIADDGAAAEATLAGLPALLLLGKLDGTKALALLDVEDVASVPRALGAALAGIGPHQLDGWFATGRLAKIHELAGPERGTR